MTPETPSREEAERMVAWLFHAGRAEIGLSHEADDAGERFRLRSGGMALLEAAVLIEDRLVLGREKEG